MYLSVLSVNGRKAHPHLQVETEQVVSATMSKVSQVAGMSEAAGGKHAG